MRHPPIDFAIDYIDHELAGNTISHVSTYTTADGQQHEIVDAWFHHDQALTRYRGSNTPAAAISPPQDDKTNRIAPSLIAPPDVKRAA